MADVNGDGTLDVLAAGVEPGVLAWYENDGSANFTKYVIDTTELIPHSFDTEDLDEDGDMDLYVTNIGRNVLYQNQGDGTFLDQTDQAGVTDTWTSAHSCWTPTVSAGPSTWVATTTTCPAISAAGDGSTIA